MRYCVCWEALALTRSFAPAHWRLKGCRRQRQHSARFSTERFVDQFLGIVEESQRRP